jgi:hypothetical protein
MTARFNKTVRFGQLRRVMFDLGYKIRRVDPRYVAFVHPDRDVFVVLPDMPSEAEVKPIDLLRAQRTLMNEGLIENEEQFSSLFLIKKGDHLIWTNPDSGHEIEVTAASGETIDGMVLITRKGLASTACPVSQLRPAGDTRLQTSAS